MGTARFWLRINLRVDCGRLPLLFGGALIYGRGAFALVVVLLIVRRELLDLTCTADLLIVAGTRVHVRLKGHDILLRPLVHLNQLNFARRLNVVTLDHIFFVAVDEQTSLGAGLKPTLLLFEIITSEPIQWGCPLHGLLVFNFCVGGSLVLREVGCLIV